ncbi:MAG TPA: ribosome small subunit-dependent GTPase A [Candidatus Limnocylindrales bacterium]|nr:ribosome small subunit-dependent GTPase A [Candidatus Limnocylindrales bacterium]
MAVEKYGWDSRVAKLFEASAPDGTQPGRVLVEHRGSYLVGTAEGDVNAKVTGRFRHEAALAEDFPAVGDWVVLGDLAAENAVIHAVLPRSSQFVRPGRGDTAGAQVVAANVDLVLLVTGLDHDFNLRRLERYVTLAWSSGAEPVIVLNKADLCEDVAERVAEVNGVAPGVPVRVLSAREGVGLDSLRPLLEQGKTVALIGSSGVGKSTIVNALLGWERQATGEVREGDQRGRHTTTVRELLVTDSGALLIDSPGMRSVGMWDADDGLADAFADVDAFAAECRFTDCAHEGEPGCAVLAAIADGRLPLARLESQRKLGREAAVQARRQDALLRATERRKWKTIHKSVRNHMRIKYGPDAS